MKWHHGHAASRATGHENGEKSKNDPFQQCKRAGEREQAQGSAMLERANRSLPRLCLTIVFVGGTQATRRHWGGKNHKKTAEKCTRAKRELVSVLVHAQRALHAPCSAHCSNGTLIDKRNGQKGMLGTRIIHVLCPRWKSVFAAMMRETVSEGGDEHFSPNWHHLLGGRRREGAMLAQRCMGRHLTSIGTSHLNSLTDMSNAFSCTKRETMEEANEQMFKGALWMAQRLRNGVVFLHGHDGEFTIMVKHGLLMETPEAPRIFSWAFDKTFKRWKTSHQTPPLSAPFARMEGSKVDGSWSGIADDLFIKDEIPDHTVETAKGIILTNASSLDETLAEDRYKQNLRKLEIVPSIRRNGPHFAGSLREDPGQG